MQHFTFTARTLTRTLRRIKSNDKFFLFRFVFVTVFRMITGTYWRLHVGLSRDVKTGKHGPEGHFTED